MGALPIPYWDSQKRKPVQQASFLDRGKDLLVDVGQATLAAGEGLVGLADIPTGGYAGKWLQEATGYDPRLSRQVLSDLYSEKRKQEQQDVSQAFDKSFLSGLGEAATTPSVVAGTLVQSLPLMLGGRGIAQQLVKLPGMAARGALAGGIGEGLITAGSQLEQIREETPDGTLSPSQYLLGAGSGALTAGIGYGAGKLAGKLDIADIDIPTGTQPAVALKKLGEKSALRRGVEGALVEGALEELPQSIGEQAAQNLATGKPVTEGLSEAAGMGLISGAGMGGVVSATQHKLATVETAKQEGKRLAFEEAKAKMVAATEAATTAVVDGKAPLSLQSDTQTLEENKNAVELKSRNDAAISEAAQQSQLIDEQANLATANIVSEEIDHQVEHPFHHALATEVGEDTNIVRAESDGIYNSIKQAGGKAVDYVKAMVQRFGETAKKYALQMWNWYKQTPLASERGSMSFEQQPTATIAGQPLVPTTTAIQPTVGTNIVGQPAVTPMTPTAIQPTIQSKPIVDSNTISEMEDAFIDEVGGWDAWVPIRDAAVAYRVAKTFGENPPLPDNPLVQRQIELDDQLSKAVEFEAEDFTTNIKKQASNVSGKASAALDALGVKDKTSGVPLYNLINSWDTSTQGNIATLYNKLRGDGYSMVRLLWSGTADKPHLRAEFLEAADSTQRGIDEKAWKQAEKIYNIVANSIGKQPVTLPSPKTASQQTTQPKEITNATQIGQQPENYQQQRENLGEGRQAAETGGGNRIGQGTEEIVAPQEAAVSEEQKTKPAAIAQDLSEEGKQTYDDFKQGKAVDVDPATRAIFDAANFAELEQSSDPAAASLADAKQVRSITPITSDFFSEKAAEDPFEQSLAKKGTTIGTLIDKLSQKFYGDVAALFNADLIVVNSKNYRSRFIPAGKDGKAKIVININDNKTGFDRVFGHELFHNLVTKLPKGQYQVFKTAVLESIKHQGKEEIIQNVMDREGISREVAEEEFLAEIFAEVFTGKDFWSNLSSDFFGQNIASRLLNHLIMMLKKFRDFLSGQTRSTFETKMLFDDQGMKNLHKLVADMVGQAYLFKDTPSSGQEMYYTPAAGYTIQNEIADTIKNQSAWFKGIWGKIFKPGTKSYKEVMTNIEGILLNIKEWIKDHKWAAVYADLWADPAQVTMVSKIAHDKELKRAIAEHQVVLKHRDAFKGMTRDQLEKMHDDIVRGGVDVTTEDGEQQAKSLGYSDAIIAAFKDYKKVSDEIYEELKKIYPDIPDMTTHYGQSIQWYRKNGNYLDTDFDYIITPEKSQLEGSKQYLKKMNLEKSTREIADEGGLDYRTIDPHELFLNYVADTAQLISLHKMMTEASTTMNPKDGLPYAKIFLMKDSLAAAKEGYYAVDDNATRILERLAGAVGFNISYNDNGQTKYHEENGEKVVYSTREEAEDALQFLQNENEVEGREYNVEEAAKAQEATTFRIIAKNKETGKSQKLNQTFDSEDAANEAILGWQERGKWADFDLKIEEEKASSSPSARLFFRKDMVRMINVLLAKDKIRNNAIGDKVMWAKNFLTSTELAISGFHAMTIMQEVVASTTTWEWAKGNKSIPIANFPKALQDSRKLAALVSYVLADKDVRAQEPAVKKAFQELLKTDNPEVWDIVEQFYHAGGQLHQDPSLRSGLHKKAHLSYTGKEDVVNIVNGKVEFNLASMSMDSFASIKEAFKEVGEEELKRNPNSPIKAKIKQALFPAEVTTAWLMEYMIPRAKAAMWMREYTLKLEKNAQKIAAGTVTKEELARDTMKFIEDRFGEVNWKNMWMTPTIKTALQFAFRSFTWFTGSWKALGKAGFDVAKLGWFKLKGENYELTEKGWWGFNAFVAYAMTVFGIKMMYALIAAAAGGEVPDDDEDEEMTANKVLREALFPRFDPADPKARVSVPSYVTEAYKIARHIGLVGNEAEYSKLISGRVNSLVSRLWEVGNNTDWRGVRIRELDDSLPVAAYKSVMHMMPVPISLDNAIKEGRMRGWQAVPLAFAGFTGAPAAATRSEAINKAYELRGKTMQGKETSEEELETKQEVRIAMHDYAKGDRSTVDKLMKEGLLSKKQFERELTKLPYINGKKNPVYKDQLAQSLRMLSVNDSLEVWKYMTDSEKKRTKSVIATKYKNAVKNGTRPSAQLKEWKAKLQDAGIL